MRKIITFLLLLLSLNIFAGTKELSPDVISMASILMNRQLSDCIQEYQQHSSQIQMITKETVDGIELIKISGITLLGGDVVDGSTEMNIKTEYVQAPFGFGKVPVYTCEFKLKKH